MTVYDVAGAANFLGLKPATIKYHVYRSKTLVPDGRIGKSIFFREETLVIWQSSKKSRGRPRRTNHGQAVKRPARD